MRSSDIHPVILAGGPGTRVRHVLGNLPKPMAEVAGRPFVEWVLRFLRARGWQRATLSTGFGADTFAAHFASQPIEGMRVDCRAEPSPRGTAGGFLHTARSLLGEGIDAPEAWLVLNGDSLLLVDLSGEADRWARQDAPVAILARHVDDARRYGSLAIDETDRLARFAEKVESDCPVPGWINAGVYLFRAEMLDRFPEPVGEAGNPSFERDVFPAWLRQGIVVSVLRTNAPFLDIGTEESLACAGDFIRTNLHSFH